MEYWWNDTDRRNWSTGRKTLYSVGGRWLNEYGALVEWYWQGKIEVLGKACPSATLSTTNPTWTGVWSRPSLCSEMPATKRLSHGTAPLKTKINLNYMWSFSSYRTVNTLRPLILYSETTAVFSQNVEAEHTVQTQRSTHTVLARSTNTDPHTVEAHSKNTEIHTHSTNTEIPHTQYKHTVQTQKSTNTVQTQRCTHTVQTHSTNTEIHKHSTNTEIHTHTHNTNTEIHTQEKLRVIKLFPVYYRYWKSCECNF
jgi:hypothetical protein